MTNWNWIKFDASFLLFFSTGFTPKKLGGFLVLPGRLNPECVEVLMQQSNLE